MTLFCSFLWLSNWASQVALAPKDLPANAGDVGSIPGLGSFPGEGHGNPLQYSCCRIPWTEEPGGLQSIGLHRVKYNWSNLADTHNFLFCISPYTLYMGCSDGSVVKNPPAEAGDSSSIPESRRSSGVENGNSLQHSCLENSMDRGVWWATVHEVAKVSDTSEQLSTHSH